MDGSQGLGWTRSGDEAKGMNGLGSHGKSGCKGNGKGGGLNIANSGAWPTRKSGMEQWELRKSVGRVGASFLLVFVSVSFVLFLFGFVVEREDTARVPRVGVLNYVASPL
jgi:hypothetical protein